MFGEKFLCEASFAPVLVRSESQLPLPLTVTFLQEAALCRQLPMEAETLTTVQPAVNPSAMTPDMRSITNNSSDPFLNG